MKNGHFSVCREGSAVGCPCTTMFTSVISRFFRSFKIKIEHTERIFQRLASSSIGEPIYMTDTLHTQITGGTVDLRNYFVSVGPDEGVD
jgi:hypothetical protein